MKVSVLLVLASFGVSYAAEPGASETETEAPSEEEPEESTPPLSLPTPAEAARLAPSATPSTRPPGVPEGWTEIPLEPEDGAGDEEVVVWGTAAVRAARARLVGSFEEAGWQRKGRDRNGDIVFRGPQPWMGTARLSDEGLIRFRGRLVSFQRVEAVEGPPSDGMEALDPNYRATAGTTRGGLKGPASRRKLEPHRQALRDATAQDLTRLRSVLAETSLRQTLAVLPDRLDAVWRSGQSLSGGPALGSPAERRAEILTFWATRPDTREGRLAMETVEAWMAEVMQRSATPATASELDAAAARRGDGRRPLR